MKLTPDLLANAPTYINPVKDRELNLRGKKIPEIVNLGVTKDQNDAIDFVDNDIRRLDGFPRMPHLSTLLLARNRISTISASIHESLPNLKTLILTSNSIAELADLNALSGLKKLTVLSIMDNPVSRKDHYRSWIIWRCPSVRILDFQRVKDKERARAKGLFSTASGEPTPLAASIMGVKSRVFEVGGSDVTGGEKAAAPLRLTEEERKRIEEAIKSASSLEEVTRLERALREGRIPE
ncbi:U2 snRNP complex subunit [Saitoella coloradoensis]